MKLRASIEAGGTKFVCAVSNQQGDIFQKTHFPTTTPDETLQQIKHFFSEFKQITHLGVGAFGPICLNTKDPHYGKILNTPKLSWRNFNLINGLKEIFPNTHIMLETDVTIAAIGEKTLGAAKEIENFIYLTVGTGIGGAVFVNNQPIRGLLHPELGHIHLPKASMEVNSFNGICPSHHDCLEGLASGEAIKQRWQTSHPENLPLDHPAWSLEAEYLAKALHNYILIAAPERIILGGGVMKQQHLFPMIRQKVQQSLNQYIQHSSLIQDIDQYIVPPQLQGDAGIKGGLILTNQI